MMGAVTPSLRAPLVEILLALATKDSLRSAAALKAPGIVPDGVDEVRFVAELERLTSASVELPAGERRLAPLLADSIAESRRRHPPLQRELGLLVKTVGHVRRPRGTPRSDLCAAPPAREVPPVDISDRALTPRKGPARPH
jgi:predicted unusual protein kinase regulating ubiquinone biosynthesis (AarF/ABC1/UbiB family)